MIYWQDMVRFVRTISRLHLEPDHRRFIVDFCKKEVPWEPLILLAESEGVDGLLYHHLSRFDEIKIPESAKNGLAKRYKKHQRNQAAILKEAERISQKLEQNGLWAIALQGVSLLPLYTTAGLRPMGDIDLLIRPDQYSHVLALLGEVGFHISHSAYPNNLIKGTLWLDIHTHILNLDRIGSRRHIFPKDLSGLWDRAQPLFSSSAGLLKPDPIDNFVLLSAHVLKHSYSRMIWLVDLNESLRGIVSLPGGQKALIRRIRVWKQEKIVLYGLTVLKGILGLKIPDRVGDALNVKPLGPVEKHLLRLRIRGLNRSEYYVLLSFLAIRGILGKMQFLYESMFPKDEIMAQIYLTTPLRSRFYQFTIRIIQTLVLIGNGLRQAFMYGPFKRG
jgi:hypothetical protein